VKYGHIITHLFMDGGRILKSVKTSYSEYIGSERMSEIVREMMKQQHKAMFIALRDGKFDAIVEMLGRLREDPAGLRSHARSEAERLFAPEVVCERISAALQRLVPEEAGSAPPQLSDAAR